MQILTPLLVVDEADLLLPLLPDAFMVSAPDLYLAGYAWRALAQVALAEQNIAQAQEHATNAVDCFRTINLPNEIETTHALLGELLTGN